VSVYFVRDTEFTPARRTLALAGFDQWVSASAGRLDYAEVSNSDQADITIRFDPSTANGQTTSHFTGLEITRAEVLVGVKNQLPLDLQCVAAHEFGHAIGIDGHSDDPDDLMYFEHVVGEPCPVTTRDLNTAKTGYCHLYGRCVVPETRSRAGTSGSVTIR
jgi:predicted Zn-dependent protease